LACRAVWISGLIVATAARRLVIRVPVSAGTRRLVVAATRIFISAIFISATGTPPALTGRRTAAASIDIDSERRNGAAVNLAGYLEPVAPLELHQRVPCARTKPSV